MTKPQTAARRPAQAKGSESHEITPELKARRLDAITRLIAKLEQHKTEFARALNAAGATEGFDVFVRTFRDFLMAHPRLHPVVLVNPESMMAALYNAARDGLMVDGLEGGIWIEQQEGTPTPTCKWRIGMRGRLKKVYTTGLVSKITSEVVYSNDLFERELGDEDRYIHKPKNTDRGERIGVYAIIHMVGGQKHRDFMSPDEIAAIRSLAERGDTTQARSPWDGPHSDELWRDAAIRRTLKRSPVSALVRIGRMGEDPLAFSVETQPDAPILSSMTELFPSGREESLFSFEEQAEETLGARAPNASASITQVLKEATPSPVAAEVSPHLHIVPSPPRAPSTPGVRAGGLMTADQAGEDVLF